MLKNKWLNYKYYNRDLHGTLHPPRQVQHYTAYEWPAKQIWKCIYEWLSTAVGTVFRPVLYSSKCTASILNQWVIMKKVSTRRITYKMSPLSLCFLLVKCSIKRCTYPPCFKLCRFRGGGFDQRYDNGRFNSLLLRLLRTG